MSAPTLKYGLNLTKKAPKAPDSPKRKRIAFDDDDEDAGPPPPSKKKLDLSTKLAAEKASKSAVSEDADIYDYDASWESTNALRLQKKAADRADAIERKPKYMTQLLASAEVRKKDQLRAKEKQLQAERDAEGEEFADKESFVTEAYKKQMEEVRKAEEEEARREEQEAKKGGGLNHFYRGLLDQKEKEHALLEKAAKEGLKAPLLDEPADEEKPAMKEGVVINENNEVVDKRQLLSAGLNVQRKPKAADAARAAEAKRPEREAFANKDRLRQGVRERQSRMLEQQLEQAARQQAEQEEAERKKVQEAAQSKKPSSDVQSARERYLARKKAAAEGK